MKAQDNVNPSFFFGDQHKINLNQRKFEFDSPVFCYEPYIYPLPGMLS